MTHPVEKSEEEWRKELNPTQYRILRRKGTEPAFKNEYWDNHEKGRYLCAGCGAELFRSERKFDSGTGWPSFWEPVRPEAVESETDRTHGMVRTEVRCARCGGHLGHLFDGSPTPNGLRYCMNSGSLKFEGD
ncbi:MAG TPA: peptide-methionine (R)-S-oxide reductase MsrB [Methanomassiliicoccales archaeon]|nr:peptide-methionine (R)-S-oxide reductase MsrB [Methanomassiliicoccales archaeon]